MVERGAAVGRHVAKRRVVGKCFGLHKALDA